MGPPNFLGGDVRSASLPNPGNGASMGPPNFLGGDAASDNLQQSRYGCFNGAA